MRKELPNWAFVLLLITEFVTMSLILFKNIIYSDDDYDLMMIATGLPRYIIWFCISWYIAGPSML